MPSAMPHTRDRPASRETTRIAGSNGSTHGVSTEAAPPSTAIKKRTIPYRNPPKGRGVPEASSSPSMTTLTNRDLNRATLARQFLLERVAIEPAVAIEHVVALQAQSARSPFVALWSRIKDFDADALRRAI